MYLNSDVRDVLPLVHAPALVTFPDDDPFWSEGGRHLAGHMPDARIVPRPGVDVTTSPAHANELCAMIEEFLTGVRPAEPTDRVLAAVLFTDIVTSTEHAAELGDLAWRELLSHYRTVVREEVRRFRGREINTRDGLTKLIATKAPGDKVRIRWVDSFGSGHIATVELATGPPQ